MYAQTISPVRNHMLAQLVRELGRPIRAAVEYYDEPAGFWRLLHMFLRHVLRFRFLFFVSNSLADNLFGITHGYLVLAEDATFHRVYYRNGGAKVTPVPLEGAHFRVSGGEHFLKSRDRAHCAMRYMHTCWYDEAGTPMLHPNIGAEAVAMVDEISQFLFTQTQNQAQTVSA